MHYVNALVCRDGYLGIGSVKHAVMHEAGMGLGSVLRISSVVSVVGTKGVLIDEDESTIRGSRDHDGILYVRIYATHVAQAFC